MPVYAIAFWLLAVGIVGSALAVVLMRNVFRAAVALMACFFLVAGVFVLLGADFLAAVQVLIYVGAVGVLILLAIMLTREAPRGSPFSRFQISSAVLGALLLGVMVWALINSPWPAKAPGELKPTTAALAERLFDLNSGFVLPFEIASVLLLAAVLGAIVLVREK